MPNEIQSIIPSEGEIVLYQPDENITLEVKLDAAHETVWLTQQQIADLFGTKRPAITKHLSNIFKSGELDQHSVSSILEHTAADGKTYKTQFYNLDAIISVGYRVNSLNATAFRRWATNVLRDLQQTSCTQTSRTIDLRQTSQRMHDRFLIIDDTVYHLGASLNELGKRLFAFSKMSIPKTMLV